MKKLVLSLTLLSFASMSFAASLSSMNSTQAKNMLSGKTITTVSKATLNGKLIDNTFTGYFNKDGTMTGKFSTEPANGPQADQGTWKVEANGKTCVTWQHWFDGKQRCVTFYKLSNALLIVGPDNNFETLVLNTDIQKGNQISS